MVGLSSARNMLFHLFPRLFWGPYSQRSEQVGINELLVLLSYDSDTDEDAEASQALFAKLRALGIPATFAVPGVQLRKGSKIYRELLEQGATFINHGGAAHTEWREGRYWSVNFYNQKSSEEVREDIREGHRIFEEVLGQPPNGFRAPHFGHFQDQAALALIHEELLRLGSYRFCSSSLAPRTRSQGPVMQMNGLWEVPITGTYQWPTRIFDSYGHLASKTARKTTDEYAHAWIGSVRDFQTRRIPALLNYYADPSHVAESIPYYEALEEARQMGVRFVDFDDLLNLVAGSA